MSEQPARQDEVERPFPDPADPTWRRDDEGRWLHWDGSQWREQEPVAPAATPPKVASRFPQWAIALAIVAGVGILIGALLFILRDRTFTMTGLLSLSSSDARSTGSPDGCAGDGGYDDIRGGALVTVQDSSGKIVGTGALDSGYDSGIICVFSFRVADVPDDSDFYSVEVSHRGGLTYTNAEAREMLSFSLGY